MASLSFVSAMSLAVLLAACTRQPAPTVQPAPENGQTNSGNKLPNGQDDGTLGQAAATGSSTMPLSFSQKALQQNYALDTSNMSYKFSYLDKNEEGPLVFTAGKAQLNIKGLKNGQSGDLTLELLEAGTAKLRGVIKDLVLKPGNNNVQLVLKPVDLPPGSTDLTIDVTLEDFVGTPPTTEPPTTTEPPATEPPTTTEPPATSNNPPPTEPPPVVTNPPTTTPPATEPPTTTPPATEPPATNPPASNGGISFASAVKPILDAHCVECHHQGFQKSDLSSFPFKGTGNQGGLADRIIQYAESGLMPPKPRSQLSAKELETLRAWRKDGMNP